ncbi:MULTISPECIES: ABC transporter permease [unclassified Agrobacterium]|uniref:ABC transporter permease n=1 Tax=unclassified Agrobacterium TaxID=2632611 RepID=UPI00244D038D|nr:MULTISPECIES: ABC transporter permease [unclassified Agrobacterium]MDH0615559.1 ABC transporter permease [Agrobacterium sp. GD03872]MDH0697519.1 ABC transporter permease [Agrobacterium sp. GD03871]MDH1060686.1 ABC transporter permease [Agrobacterium sp. GD03992]MDH2213317.1 ABC transporter permease [Agrobacterium sp. GD03643]MDH2221931.1 ABC transporter permease [Agrobacterium sp. GD03638]
MSAIILEPATIARRRGFTPEDRIFVSIGLYGALTLAIAVPLALMFLWSIADGWSPPLIVPKDYTTARWASILNDGSLIRAAVNSILIAIVVTFLTAAIALPTAWAMARFPFRLKRLVEIFILAPIIIPGLVVAVGIGQVFLLFGLAYSVTGVILVQIVGTLPLMIRLMTAALETIPDDLIHAARSLGAGTVGIVFHIILPLAVPGLLAGGLMSFIGSFEEFDKSFIVGAPVVETLPIKLYMYLDPYSMQLPLAAIVSFILLLPALIVFIIAGRILRDDLMAAGMGKI